MKDNPKVYIVMVPRHLSSDRNEYWAVDEVFIEEAAARRYSKTLDHLTIIIEKQTK